VKLDEAGYPASGQRKRQIMEDVQPKVDSGNSIKEELRRTIGGTRLKPKDNRTVGSPILLAKNAMIKL